MDRPRMLVLGGLAAILIGVVPIRAAAAVSRDDFLVRRTSDLVALCSAGSDDPLYEEAVHFCHGYLVGAFQYRQAEYAGSKRPITCLPAPQPSRNQTVQMFVSWARAHPEFSNERPADSFARFLDSNYACHR